MSLTPRARAIRDVAHALAAEGRRAGLQALATGGDLEAVTGLADAEAEARDARRWLVGVVGDAYEREDGQ